MQPKARPQNYIKLKQHGLQHANTDKTWLEEEMLICITN